MNPAEIGKTLPNMSVKDFIFLPQQSLNAAKCRLFFGENSEEHATPAIVIFPQIFYSLFFVIMK